MAIKGESKDTSRVYHSTITKTNYTHFSANVEDEEFFTGLLRGLNEITHGKVQSIPEPLGLVKKQCPWDTVDCGSRSERGILLL